MTRRRRSVFELLEAFPPYLCRLVARGGHGRRALTVRELAQRSGLSKDTISRLGARVTWAGVSVSVMERFSAACGVNHLRLKPHLRFLREYRWTHVARASGKQRELFEKLMRLTKH